MVYIRALLRSAAAAAVSECPAPSSVVLLNRHAPTGYELCKCVRWPYY